MEFRVLAVGDVVGKPGLTYLGKRLRKLRRQVGADLCVVNGENAAMNGMTPDQGEAILDAGRGRRDPGQPHLAAAGDRGLPGRDQPGSAARQLRAPSCRAKGWESTTFPAAPWRWSA